jgi:hypothetical protein
MHSAILTLHVIVGVVVVLTALLLVWRRAGRRLMLYVLTLQIVLGIAAVALTGARSTPEHWVTAVIGWAGYMLANGLQRRRGASRATVLAITIGSSLLVVYAFYVGLRAMRAAP